MKNIADADYKHAKKKVCKNFELKNLDENHDFYAHNNIILLADVFKNFRNKCIEIYELDPVYFYLHLD